ncbi:hypothetical protein KA005_77345 [bacterium]|nr:hypothetical protein [bacterium]
MFEKISKDLNNAKILLFFGGIIWTGTAIGMDFHFVSESELQTLERNKVIDKIADLEIKIKHSSDRQKLMLEELKTRAEANLKKMETK